MKACNDLNSVSLLKWKLTTFCGILFFGTMLVMHFKISLWPSSIFLGVMAFGFKRILKSIDATMLIAINHLQLVSSEEIKALQKDENAKRDIVNIKKKMSNIALDNAYSISSFAKYLETTSGYLLALFNDQFLLLRKVEDQARDSQKLVGDVELRIVDATRFSQQAKTGADTGKMNMTNLTASVRSLNEVEKLLLDFTKILNSLTTQMQKIDNVVFDTKILSLNATIEVARLGDAGRGMSVVVYEIGVLAREIGCTSSEIQATLKTCNESLSSVNSKVNYLISDSTQLINSSQSSLGNVIDNIYVLTEKITEINGSLSKYKKSTEKLDEIVNDIGKTSNTLGTAAANIGLVKLNLDELENNNKSLSLNGGDYVDVR